MLLLCFTMPGDKVHILIHTYHTKPLKRLKVDVCNVLTAHFMWSKCQMWWVARGKSMILLMMLHVLTKIKRHLTHAQTQTCLSSSNSVDTHFTDYRNITTLCSVKKKVQLHFSCFFFYLLNVICSYSWTLSAIESCNHYTSSKLTTFISLSKSGIVD